MKDGHPGLFDLLPQNPHTAKYDFKFDINNRFKPQSTFGLQPEIGLKCYGSLCIE